MEMEKNKKNRYGFDFTPMGLDIKTFRESQKITREKLAETLDITPRHWIYWIYVNALDKKSRKIMLLF